MTTNPQTNNQAPQLTIGSSPFGRLGGQLGVLLCLVGFAAIFFGWNGAAGKNVIMAQFPFLISGGIAGLAVVVIGASMLIVQNAREDRARLEATLERLITAVEHNAGAGRGLAQPGSAGMVLAGSASYHRLECTLPAAREEAHLLPIEQVLNRGLAPCRVCNPPALAPTYT